MVSETNIRFSNDIDKEMKKTHDKKNPYIN